MEFRKTCRYLCNYQEAKQGRPCSTVERMQPNNPSIRRRTQVHIDETYKMTTSGSPIDFSKSGSDDAELNPLVAPFQMSLVSQVDDEKKSMSIFPRSFYGRRRLVVVASCAILVACIVGLVSHGKSTVVFCHCSKKSVAPGIFDRSCGRLNQSLRCYTDMGHTCTLYSTCTFLHAFEATNWYCWVAFVCVSSLSTSTGDPAR